MKNIIVDTHGKVLLDDYIILDSGITVVMVCKHDSCSIYIHKVREMYFNNNMHTNLNILRENDGWIPLVRALRSVQFQLPKPVRTPG